jgi:hypothetical protein
MLAFEAYVPVVSSRKVMNNTMKSALITPFKPNAAIIIIPVTIVQAGRNSPIASYAVDAGGPPAIEWT